MPLLPRLPDRLRGAIRLRHYSIRTEATYVDWARRFILFHDKRHPTFSFRVIIIWIYT